MKKDTTQRGTAVPAGKPSLPHERDQQKTATNPTPDAQVDQAARDLKQGQVDTDLRATPGLDADRRGDLVKGGEHGAGDGKPRPQR
jgi:hypothetical protein